MAYRHTSTLANDGSGSDRIAVSHRNSSNERPDSSLHHHSFDSYNRQRDASNDHHRSSANGNGGIGNMLQPNNGNDYHHNNHHYNHSTGRSRPISIRRPSDVDTSDEEDIPMDDERIHLDGPTNSSASSGGGEAHSLPSRLLRAPLLGSIPTNEAYLRHRNLLPPTLQLSATGYEAEIDNSDIDNNVSMLTSKSTHVSYGSLRDSQLQQRLCFDGRPSSFLRNQHTTTTTSSSSSLLRRPARSVRFQAAASSAPTNNGLSIGERMQQSRKLQQQLQSKKQQLQQQQQMTTSKATTAMSSETPGTLSSLAVMMESSSMSSAPVEAVPTAAAIQKGEEGQFGDLGSSLVRNDESMLSTSLTGLEILKRGLGGHHRDPRLHAAAAAPPIVAVVVEPQQLPQQHHMRPVGASSSSTLSRSYSDPVYRSSLRPLGDMDARVVAPLQQQRLPLQNHPRHDADDGFLLVPPTAAATASNHGPTIVPAVTTTIHKSSGNTISSNSNGSIGNGTSTPSTTLLYRPSPSTTPQMMFYNSDDSSFQHDKASNVGDEDSDFDGAFDLDME